ncbi:ABC transporter ATP-binding protein [Virgibacillus necropolis]|uniref:ABC transporter ATP-binding protein n=1 Tax=Virgibacillus necropolis TaxID=163877 RepID=A0A221MDD4_9BACI|nr:ABC transporter ATP-binding protein [Virgibacillus necropolis]ASN05589.1 ABC transporter ATP-binding protein [Virgibacillus necropolis]
MAFSLKNIKVNDIITINELTVPSQKVTCIVGQSGSGKSTFLRLLNNLDNPDSGKIYYQDRDIQTLDPIQLRRKVTMVPQSPVIYEGTIRDNVVVGLKYAGLEPVSDQYMNDILHKMKLNKYLDTIADELSGGEKQRLALTRSMLLDAEVFLLDEPSSSLDDKTALHVIQAFMRHMKERQKTVVMVTHDKELAEEVSDNLINMDTYSEQIANGGE